MSLMNKKMLSVLIALSVILIAGPVWACKLVIAEDIAFKLGEAQLSSEAIRSLTLIPKIEVQVIIFHAVIPSKKQKDDPVSKID